MSARMLLNAISLAALLGCATPLTSHAQDSRWADPKEPTAKALIDLERQWAESGCTHNNIEKVILAEDYHGIAPDGAQYGKAEAVASAASTKTPERECVMYDVKVHFFGDSMAVLYGSESALRTGAHGKPHRVKLTWTDTWLKRNGTWQVVAAQDMPSDMP